MNVYVLLQVLVLGELFFAEVAHEAFEVHVVNHDVSPQALTVAEFFQTVLFFAHEGPTFILATHHFF